MDPIKRHVGTDTRETVGEFPIEYLRNDLLDRYLAGEFDINEMRQRFDALAEGFASSSLPGIAIEATPDQ